jgi:murein DD-endopeptidase MepM/ murein hydrolase activator NlpD
VRRFGVVWLAVVALLSRNLLWAATVGSGFVIVSSLAATVVEGAAGRAAAGAAVAVGLPLLVRWQLGRLLAGRRRRPPRLAVTFAAVNGALAALLAFGFADDTGRALRRHGDWFIGERNGAVARGGRALLATAAGALERFDPAPEIVLAPPLQGGRPARWQHPLAGPRRVMPARESQRFGAARPQPRPFECELGHCGVDLVAPRGAPVHAVFDGVVEKLERDARRGGRAGIYQVVAHGSGGLRSRYIHLDAIAPDLAVGAAVRAGQVIGTLGATGIERAAPHLHFGLQIGARYVDPEPYLGRWALPAGDQILTWIS